MRDKNLSYSKFNIQFEKNLRGNSLFSKFFSRAVIDSPTFLEEDTRIIYPRDFRLLRNLCIIHWYFPEELHWRIRLDLEQMNLNHLNSKQKIEISIYLESKDIMLIYLYNTNRYTSHEIFGNFLGNDLKDLLRNLKFYRKRYKLVESQRKRGYDDKGSRKPDCEWLPSFDYSLTEYQNEVERKLKLEFKVINRIKKTLRTLIAETNSMLE